MATNGTANSNTMEAHEAKGLIPERTAVLRSSGGGAYVRGLARAQYLPVSSAVVIGLGGSGVQTIARVRAALLADRPDQTAVDAIQLLGIDSVDVTEQNPPLPAGVDLSRSEFLTLNGFNAYAFINGRLGTDDHLKAFWDTDYEPPRDPLTDGFKRERMLGRLGFREYSMRIAQQISSAMSRAMSVKSEAIQEGSTVDTGGKIRVFIVSSCAGGTGSSGFLEVVAAVHAAAQGIGVQAEIRSFTFLPGVFHKNVLEAPNGEIVARAQRANAYAFFRELDHFMVYSSEVAEYVNRPGLEIPDNELVKQAFILDSSLDAIGQIENIADVYEIAAEGIYQFLMCDMGRMALGVNGTNADQELKSFDLYGKPRRYCSFGIARVVLPGDTLRHHLTMRWCDWMIRGAFLRQADPIAIRESTTNEDIIGIVLGVINKSTNTTFDEIVTDFRNNGADAPQSLRTKAEAAYANEILTQLEGDLPVVISEMQTTLRELRPRLLDELRSELERSLFAKGQSVPEARELLKNVRKRIDGELVTATSRLNGQIAGKASQYEALEEALDKLEDAEARNLIEAAGAYMLHLFNDEVLTKTEAAEAVGERIKDWSAACIESERALSRKLFLEDTARYIQLISEELARAEDRLNQLAERAKTQWEADILIGKDAGPLATTSLIPNDTLPQVEWSQLAVSCDRQFMEEHANLLGGDDLTAFIQRWCSEANIRGFFDFGLETAKGPAEDTLLASLERDAESFAIRKIDPDPQIGTIMRLPTSLPDAAAAVGETDQLNRALYSLASLTANVLWRWEKGRFHLEGDDAGVPVTPIVNTGIVFDESARAQVEAQLAGAQKFTFNDPERIVALSSEWAVPFHCLSVVHEWKRDYDLLAKRRERQRTKKSTANPVPGGVEAPNHIDRRFEDALKPLIPDYLKPEESARDTVRALLVALLIKDKAVVETCFVRDANMVPSGPIARVPNGPWLGYRISLDSGLLRSGPASTAAELGTGWFDLVRAIGTKPQLGVAVTQSWEVIEANVAATLISSAASLLSAQLETAKRARRISVEDKQALGWLINATQDFTDANNIAY
jgi:Tubulin like